MAFVAPPPAPCVAPIFPKGPLDETHSAVSAGHWAAAIFRDSRSRRHGCSQIKLAQNSTLRLRLAGNQRKKARVCTLSLALLLCSFSAQKPLVVPVRYDAICVGFFGAAVPVKKSLLC